MQTHETIVFVSIFSRPVEALEDMVVSGPPEIYDEQTTVNHIYGSPENPTVKIVREEPISEDVINRLIKEGGLLDYTAAKIKAREWLLLEDVASGEVADEALAEQYALLVLHSLKKVIDASAVRGNNGARLEIGTLHNEYVTRRAIKLAEIAMKRIDPEHLHIVSHYGSNGAELNTIDVDLSGQIPKQLTLEDFPAV